MTESTATLSVIMPVYNGEKFVAQAIESILSQTFTKFEFIIINDGSTDTTAEILKKYAQKDSRIKLFHQENKGLVKTITSGIQQAEGQFIARMDADDISHPERFAIQIKSMMEQKIDILGSYVQPFNNQKAHPTRSLPESHDDIVFSLIFFNPIAHPSVVVNSNVFSKIQYQDVIAEDYELWCQAAAKGLKFANCPSTLLKYRVHDGQLTTTAKENIRKATQKIAVEYAQQLGPLEAQACQARFAFQKSGTADAYKSLAADIKLLQQRYNVSDNTIADLLLTIFKSAPKRSLAMYLAYFQASQNLKARNVKLEMKFFLKSLFGPLRKKQLR